MFNVIVAGGIALVALAPGAAAGCGRTTASTTNDAGGAHDGFPAEGPAQMDAFPQEGPPPLPESGVDASAEAGFDAFPQEGPNIEAGFFDTGTHDAATEAGSDAAGNADGFPQETAP
jgi:hypothetical protein